MEKENPHAVGIMFLYTPFPQTEMYDYVIKRGFKPPQQPSEWAGFNYDTWYKIYPSWLSKEMIKLVEGAVFLSYFDNKNIAYKYPDPIMQLVFRLYHPIAKFRSENNFYNFLIEKKIANLFSYLNEKYDLVGKLKGKKKN